MPKGAYLIVVDEDDRPRLTVAASTSEEDIALQRSLRRVERNARALATNMIRVVRGAGEPRYLFDQVNELYSAMKVCPEHTTVGDLSDALERALGGGLEEGEDDISEAIHIIERGVLRKVAANLIGQKLQVSAGSRDLWDGIVELERARERASQKRPEPFTTRDAKLGTRLATIRPRNPDK